MDEPLTTGLTWLGTRTTKYSETVAFFKEGLGLMPLVERPHFAAFDLPDGSIIEVFGPSDRDHVHFGSAPVAGLLVLDIEAATRRIEAAGGMFLAPMGHDGEGNHWAHFRAPDGNVYEITQRDSENGR
jgi:predicted enzyme related to lactoylglutathione lyase